MSLKPIQNTVLYVVTALIMLLHGCIEDKCAGLQCVNESVCVNGSCACAYGYEGQYCELQWYEKFAGQWSVKETNKAGTILQQYSVSTSYYRSVDTFQIRQFRTQADTVLCARESFETFTFLSKKLPGGDSIISGKATLNMETGIVTGLYSLYKDSTATNVSFTWTK